ncbi:MAG: hypothetical protein JWO46_1258 [Nocardioidaceae bacterium]|nr:hypothetical protein [Nocardioidaceae bacterium]
MTTTGATGLELARTVADAVLYEGYLLYPYRASSDKNRSRWQFGVLGPVGACDAGVGEAAGMRMQTVVTSPAGGAAAVVHLRFLRSQLRQVLDADGQPVERAVVDGDELLTWEEAVEHEHVVRLDLATLGSRVVEHEVRVDGDVDAASGGVVRHRWPIQAVLTARLTIHGRYAVLGIEVRNTAELEIPDRTEAIHHSLIGAHLLIEAEGFEFVSMTDPPDEAAELAGTCSQDRCWPVLTGTAPRRDLLLGSPIILYDYPEIAPESAGALFDSTEIDEILTLRVMTMTEAEKAEARATDPRAREIIDRCDEMTPEGLQQLHGILRNPRVGEPDVYAAPPWPGATEVGELEPTSFETDVPWWSPEADEGVQPGSDTVVIDGVSVSRDSFVRVHPKRRADAQDLFFDDQVARVTAVLSDVDGGTHVALVLADDPAADLHDLAGRYWYFAPDELEPLPAGATHRKESS